MTATVKHQDSANHRQKKAAAARKRQRIKKIERETPVHFNPAALIARPAVLTWLDYRGICEEWRGRLS
jgi:hypothetical protein